MTMSRYVGDVVNKKSVLCLDVVDHVLHIFIWLLKISIIPNPKLYVINVV